MNGYSHLDVERLRARRVHQYADEARIVARIQSAILAGIDVEVVGFHGTGKTEAVYEVAANMGADLFGYTCTAQTTYWDLVEEHTMNAGTSVMKGKVITDFLMFEATKDRHAILVLDEIPKAYQTVLGFLHELTDARGSIYLSHSNKRLARTPYHHVVLTYNPTDKGNYVGFSLDPAFRDRFATIRAQYVGKAAEQRILLSYFGHKIEAPQLNGRARKDENVDAVRFSADLTAFANLVREAYQKGDLTNTVTTRGLITIVRLVKDARWSVGDAVGSQIEKFTEEEIPKVAAMWQSASKEIAVKAKVAKDA